MSAILGVVMARNEWPILGLAVVHVLSSGADKVLVVDHDSTDSTLAGLARLQGQFPQRIFIAKNLDSKFRQAESIRLALDFFGASEFDWIYPFDADEFMMFSGSENLKTITSNVPQEVSALKYELQNWLAPQDLNHLEADDYSRVSHRAIANEDFQQGHELMRDRIKGGSANYFDFPFLSKVILRGSFASGIEAGAHGAAEDKPKHYKEAQISTAWAAHLPFASYSKLLQKVEQAERLTKAGFGRSQGWQSHLIRDLKDEGLLNEFWLRHSVRPEGAVLEAGEATYVESDGFSKLLHEATQVLKRQAAKDEQVPIIEFKILESQIDLFAALIAERDSLVAERDGLLNSAPRRITKWMRKIASLLRR